MWISFFHTRGGGRKAYNLLLLDIIDGDCLTTMLKQATITIKGCPLAIQLLAFKDVPLLEKLLPVAVYETTFTNRLVGNLAKLKTIHHKDIINARRV